MRKVITQEEREEIINAAVEKALLMLPDTVGNLIVNHAAMAKLTSGFYAAHPEFKDHKDAVVAILEKLESDNPGKKYEELLDVAAPAITERIRIKQSLNTTHVQSRTEVDRKLPHLDLGEL